MQINLTTWLINATQRWYTLRSKCTSIKTNKQTNKQKRKQKQKQKQKKNKTKQTNKQTKNLVMNNLQCLMNIQKGQKLKCPKTNNINTMYYIFFHGQVESFISLLVNALSLGTLPRISLLTWPVKKYSILVGAVSLSEWKSWISFAVHQLKIRGRFPCL